MTNLISNFSKILFFYKNLMSVKLVSLMEKVYEQNSFNLRLSIGSCSLTMRFDYKTKNNY